MKNTFTFKHKHRLLKNVLYTATKVTDGYKVTWMDKNNKQQEVTYTFEAVEHAFRIGDWKEAN